MTDILLIIITVLYFLNTLTSLYTFFYNLISRRRRVSNFKKMFNSIEEADLDTSDKKFNTSFEPVDKYYNKHGKVSDTKISDLEKDNEILSETLEDNTYTEHEEGVDVSDKLYRLKSSKSREYIQKPLVNQAVTDLIKEDSEMLFAITNEAVETYLVNYSGETISSSSMMNFLKRSFENIIIEQFKQNPDILSSEVEMLNDETDGDNDDNQDNEGAEDLNTEQPEGLTDEELEGEPEELLVDNMEDNKKRKLRKKS